MCFLWSASHRGAQFGYPESTLNLIGFSEQAVKNVKRKDCRAAYVLAEVGRSIHDAGE